MRAFNILLTIMVFTMISACGPVITFDEPQPPGADNLSHFPKRLQGKYISDSGANILSITENSIVKTYDYDLVVHPSDIDSSQKVKGDTLYNLNTKEKIAIRFRGDSLLVPIYYADTIFSINPDMLLRKFKGHYLLNLNNEKTGWEVQLVDLSKGRLTLSSISSEAGIEALKQLSETPVDSFPSYQVKTTRRQLHTFINNNGFTDKETYTRIR
ncbi:MAG TPA: hypothetical protein VK172_09115 [Lentimicrobium sp.]|nr:hypothetical protein [Lentimicrobium sp.]